MNKRALFFTSVLSSATIFSACNSSHTLSDSTNDTDNNDTAIVEAYLKDVPEYTDRMYVYKTTSNFDIGSSQSMFNREASVPAMCYTKHDEQYNPCYVCHQDKVSDGRANVMDDGFLQNEYLFSDFAMTNHWTNLFKDRTAQIAQISDQEIETYVNMENYSGLKGLLESNEFAGYIPDLENYYLGADAFNEDGFAKDGSGWVAFNYKPLPSTFWPVNGSTDDVLIRLHKDYRQTVDGNFSVTAYKFNLAIVEAAIKNLDTISVDNLDENIINRDLNEDGKLGIVNRIKRPDYYVGKASYMKVETFLYPRYTEFLHSVRYIGTTKEGDIYNAPRMKELRYMIKVKSYQDEVAPLSKYELALLYEEEWQEKYKGDEPFFSSLLEKGLDNAMGWWIQGFIEDEKGDLRPQTYEETFYCMGCHTTLGSTIDQVFSFARKIDGAKGWGYIDLKKMKDTPNQGETEGEVLTYLKRAGGGSEFRIENDIHTKFYDDGVLNEEKVKSAESIYELITPTRASALEMNKAYRTLVQTQDFIHGREVHSKAVNNVYREITEETPALPVGKKYDWDMRLDWSELGGEE